MTSALDCVSSVLTPHDTMLLDQIAVELARPDLAPERRLELTDTLASIAEKYTCDPRLTDNL